MKIAVLERLLIQGILPREGNFLEMTVLAHIRELLDLTQKEQKDFEFKPNDAGGVSWNEEKAKEIDVDFTDAEVDSIVAALKKRDETKTLTPEFLDVYRRFVIDSETK